MHALYNHLKFPFKDLMKTLSSRRTDAETLKNLLEDLRDNEVKPPPGCIEALSEYQALTEEVNVSSGPSLHSI